MNLSKNFTFEQLTTTAITGLQEINRQQAVPFTSSLRRVAEELLEPILGIICVPLFVTSGFRGPVLNKDVGGSATSQHCHGEAADFNGQGYSDRFGQMAIVRWMLEDFKKRGYKWGQLLLERGCIHISLGEKCEVAEYDVATKEKKPIEEL